jgi:hypothetical protein
MLFLKKIKDIIINCVHILIRFFSKKTVKAFININFLILIIELARHQHLFFSVLFRVYFIVIFSLFFYFYIYDILKDYSNSIKANKILILKIIIVIIVFIVVLT